MSQDNNEAASAPDLATVHAFLLGEGTLEGLGFEELPGVGGPKGRYWWRKFLSAAIAASASQSSTAGAAKGGNTIKASFEARHYGCEFPSEEARAAAFAEFNAGCNAALAHIEGRREKGAVAYCKACNAAGMSNCGSFDECGGPQCVTCHQQLPGRSGSAHIAPQAAADTGAADAAADIGHDAEFDRLMREVENSLTYSGHTPLSRHKARKALIDWLNTKGAQQREAGRSQGMYEMNRKWVEEAAIARQPVSEGLTKADRHMWNLQEFYQHDAAALKVIEECRAILALYAVPPAKAEGLTDDRTKHAHWLLMEFAIHRYLMSNAHGRWDGAEKAQRHMELCQIVVAVAYGLSPDRARQTHEDAYQAVHDATQELTGYMDEVIGFPLETEPDYDALAPLFFERFMELADRAILAQQAKGASKP